ncbi:uncharacterized protein V1510DRAFT_432365 [Dipodascopsis tothii]|uniref:uncharacterized protein n=1 Tax=Dipodascopsis tothii TaxID=44089 RepID=UPI0034CEBF49
MHRHSGMHAPRMAGVLMAVMAGAVAQTIEELGPQPPSGSGPSEDQESAMHFMLWLVPRIVFRIVRFVTRLVASRVLLLLGSTVSVTVSFSTLLVIFAVFAGVGYLVVRYRYLNVYSRLHEEPHRDEPKLDLFPVPPESTKPGLSNYLDEFFSAIKVFGYLDRPAFHELTRLMQTRKLIAGDTMALEEENGFCIVVDGAMQIYTSSEPDVEPDVSQNGSGYSLLTEVRNGAPMSSLFTILSLFTEDVKVSGGSASPGGASSPDLSAGLPPTPRIQLLSFSPELDEPASPRPAIIAYAKEDSTIAIIPAEAFRRLTRKYPKATAHIVQVILTRFQRVTFQTGHNYLGLTAEIVKAEVAFNKTATEQPLQLPPGVLERVKVLCRARSDREPAPQPSAGELFSRPQSPHSPRPDLAESADGRRVCAGVAEILFDIIGAAGQALTRSPTNDSSRPSPRLGPLGNMALESALDDESVTSSSANAPPVALTAADLEADLELEFYPKGELIVRSGERNKGLFYVLDGFVDICTAEHDRHGGDVVYTVKPGGVGGYIGSLSVAASFVDVRARTDVYLAFLPRAAFDRIADRHPAVLLTMAKRLTTVLSNLLMYLDFGLEWVQVDAGQILYREGDEADAIYIVLNGRMRAVADTAGEARVLREYAQGDSLGELEVLTVSRRAETVHAVRDTELVRFPRLLFERLASRYPHITIQISRTIASRVSALVGKSALAAPLRASATATAAAAEAASTMATARTVAVLPVTAGLPVKDFGLRLERAVHAVNRSAVLLNQAEILRHLGRHAFNALGKLKLTGHLADLEQRYQMVIYVADTTVSSPWTQTCISQADCILLLANAQADPAIGEYERLLLRLKTTARKELVLLHPEKYVHPGQTNAWLKTRIWIQSHHHVEMRFRPALGATRVPTAVMLSTRIKSLKDRVQTTLQSEIIKYASLYLRNGGGGRAELAEAAAAVVAEVPGQVQPKSDFARLARLLTGQAIGLVLGGGGARGMAHLGVIRAIEEAGIPVDIVGGTSIGAFVGGLYARDADLVPIYARAKQFSGRIASLWRMALDLTYPATSYTTGHEFNRGIWKAFGDSRIEDFWLRYYTNTTNITHSRMEIHEAGYAWRFIRASMSLAGLLPPLTDAGSMLLDGGYMDNLTVDHMKALGAKSIFAVDVGSIDDTTPMTYGDSLSGMWILFNRWNPFSRHPNIPNLAEIQARLAYVSSVGALERAKLMDGCIYMRPPIDSFGTLDFGKFQEIYEIGYKHGKDTLDQLRRESKLPEVNVGSDRKRPSIVRRNSI